MGANKESQQQDNFFKIPTELKDKLKENPEILQLIETTGKDWQANWTKKRQDEAKEVQQIRDQVSGMESYKQKAEAMDRLLSKASFTEYLVNEDRIEKGLAPLGSNQSNQPVQQNDPFAEYEDAGAINVMMDTITERVTKAMDDRFQPLMKNMAQDKESSDIGSVRSFIEEQRAKGQQLPDADENTLRLNMRKYNMPAMDAYRLSAANYMMANTGQSLVDKSILQMDNSQIAQQGETGAEQNDNIVTQQGQRSADAMLKPGGGSVSLLLRGEPKGVDAKLSQAQSINDGKEPAKSTRQHALDTIGLMNEVLGTKITVNDL